MTPSKFQQSQKIKTYQKYGRGRDIKKICQYILKHSLKLPSKIQYLQHSYISITENDNSALHQHLHDVIILRQKMLSTHLNTVVKSFKSRRVSKLLKNKPTSVTLLNSMYYLLCPVIFPTQNMLSLAIEKQTLSISTL